MESPAQEEEEEGQEQEEGWGEGTGNALEVPEGNVVLDNCQAAKAHQSRVWAGLHL